MLGVGGPAVAEASTHCARRLLQGEARRRFRVNQEVYSRAGRERLRRKSEVSPVAEPRLGPMALFFSSDEHGSVECGVAGPMVCLLILLVNTKSELGGAQRYMDGCSGPRLP